MVSSHQLSCQELWWGSACPGLSSVGLAAGGPDKYLGKERRLALCRAGWLPAAAAAIPTKATLVLPSAAAGSLAAFLIGKSLLNSAVFIKVDPC